MDWTQITLAIVTPIVGGLVSWIGYLIRSSGKREIRLNAKIEFQGQQIFDLLQQRVVDEIKRRESTDESTRLMRELLAQTARAADLRAALMTKGTSS